MTAHDISELRRNVTALRDQTFDLLERMRSASSLGDRPVASAAAQLQSVANRLGAVESALFEPRAA